MHRLKDGFDVDEEVSIGIKIRVFERKLASGREVEPAGRFEGTSEVFFQPCGRDLCVSTTRK
jgi:hypothetical protein